MKIVHLVENMDDSYGGPARSIPLLCKYLNGLGIQTLILSVKLHASEHNHVIEQNDLQWESFDFDYSKKLRVSKKFRNRVEGLAKEEGTIFHVHNSWNYVPYLANSIRKKYSIPLVISVRGSMYPWSLKQRKWVKRLAWNFFQRKALEDASVIHATEENEAKALRELGIKNKISIVPNGVELSFSKIKRNEAIKLLGLKKNVRYVLFLSRIHPKKGVEYLIESFSKLTDEFPNWELLIVGPVGDQKYYHELTRKVTTNGLSEKIHFLGSIEGEKKRAVFSASEIFVLPSHTENFGIVIAEALVYNLPVITTTGTPWKEIEEYKSGWYIKLDQEKLTIALSEAMSKDEKRLTKIGENSNKFIKNYSWEIQAKKMLEVYECILKKRTTN